MPTTDVQAEEVSCSSESDTQPAKKENLMIELNEAATKEYPNIPAVMISPLIKKLHEVLRQDVLNKLSVRYRCGGINPLASKIKDKRVKRELSQKEAHSYTYLMQNEEFEVSKKEVQAKMKDLRAHGYYSDTLMLFENFSANLDAVRNRICYIHRCEGVAELVLEIQGIELAHRYAKIFQAYNAAILGRSPLLLEYALTQESQFLLRNELRAQLSTTISLDPVYKALLVGDGRQLLLANKEFQPKYSERQRPVEIYEADFEEDPQFLCFEDDPAFEIAVRAGVQRPGKAGGQYLANFLGGKRDAGTPIPLIYFSIQETDPKKLKAEGGVDKILTAARGVPAQLAIDLTLQSPNNNFQQLATYEQASLPTAAIDLGYGIGLIQQIPCGGNPLATPNLSEIHETPYAEYAVILATVKCVAHADAVEIMEHEAPPGVLDCSTVVAMDPVGRMLLLETMGARARNDDWARRHFKNRRYQPPDGLESQKNAVVGLLATLIGAERLSVG